jgi:hypothetical protein
MLESFASHAVWPARQPTAEVFDSQALLDELAQLRVADCTVD